ncbi:MAG: DUF72 domain-containing protein [Acidobacteria bacterium]|nr:DUF72 domain-containing protein [Acidobacteriota bacterium]
MPRYWVGTSGYNYPEWRGSFYPEKHPQKKMLPYYAARLDTVEINYTFYRMPTVRLLAGWSEQTPGHFRFTLKAPRRITHEARLANCAETARALCDAAGTLAHKRGTLLFQLPPFFRKSLDRLKGFLDVLPEGARPAFEFRHASWHDDDVLDCLASSGAALCVSDSEKLRTPVEVTAPFAYFRLRDQGYTDDDLIHWAGTIRKRTADCDDVYVYFKHEERGAGPLFAARLLEQLRA